MNEWMNKGWLKKERMNEWIKGEIKNNKMNIKEKVWLRKKVRWNWINEWMKRNNYKKKETEENWINEWKILESNQKIKEKIRIWEN